MTKGTNSGSHLQTQWRTVDARSRWRGTSHSQRTLQDATRDHRAELTRGNAGYVASKKLTRSMNHVRNLETSDSSPRSLLVISMRSVEYAANRGFPGRGETADPLGARSDWGQIASQVRHRDAAAPTWCCYEDLMNPHWEVLSTGPGPQ